MKWAQKNQKKSKTYMILRTLVFILVVVPILIVLGIVQKIILWLKFPFWHAVPMLAHKVVCTYLGIKITQIGKPAKGKPTLLLSNHISWMDIPAIGSAVPISFVAKAEVGRWPVVRTLARMQKTIFVDRTRKTDTGRVVAEMSARMNEGRAVVLFAEGTSDIGSHVLPFRSALVGATQAAMKAGDASEIYIQPMCIAYTQLNGLPISRAERTKIAWVGDMGLMDNMSDILLSGSKSVSIMFGEPILIDDSTDRKAITRQAHAQVRDMLVSLNRGLPLPKAHLG
jgi:1-acyl-sn-glycerol-3-phosphate acyltransferase